MSDSLGKQIRETIILHEMKTPGFIHKDQLPKLLEDLGIVILPAESARFLTKFPADAKGLIKTAAITEVVDPLLRRLNEEKLKEYMSVFDRDKDDLIPVEDFDYAITNFGKGLNETDLKKMHALAGNKDPVDINELAKALMG